MLRQPISFEADTLNNLLHNYLFIVNRGDSINVQAGVPLLPADLWPNTFKKTRRNM